MGRHDADDDPWKAVDRDLRSHDRRVAAEASLQQIVADDDRRSLPWDILLLSERAAEERRHAEDGEKRIARSDQSHSFRFAAAGDRGFTARVRSEAVQRPHAALVVEEVGLRREPVRGLVSEGEESLRVRIWQRMKQDAADDAEDRRVRADAEGEGGEDDDRERRTSKQPTHRVGRILHQIGHGHLLRKFGRGGAALGSERFVHLARGGEQSVGFVA